MRLDASGDLGIYIHVPFCPKKCYYCDFETTIYGEAMASRYVGAVAAEAALVFASLPPDAARNVSTIFFGGGTPSTLHACQVQWLLNEVREHFPVLPDCEITLEANPQTRLFSIAGELEQLRSAGVNRLSLGLQTFDDSLLVQIGRTHSAAAAVQAFQQARAAGFANLSLDLIFALPGQCLDAWTRTLDRALQLEPEHISLYGLTIEPGTVYGRRFERGELTPAQDDLEAEMYSLAIQKLSLCGYQQYEISNFARPGFASAHNQRYWRRQDYIGLGVGAHSCLGSHRRSNRKSTPLYIHTLEAGQLFVESEEDLSPEKMLGEAMWLGLRMNSGVSLRGVEDRYGLDVEAKYGPVIQSLRLRGLLDEQGDILCLTPQGRLLGNTVFSAFV